MQSCCRHLGLIASFKAAKESVYCDYCIQFRHYIFELYVAF